MLKHFHAGDNVKTAGLFDSKCFSADLTVLHPLSLSLQRMKLCNFQGFSCEVNAKYSRPFTRHGVGKNSAATPHIQYTQPL